MHKPVVFITGTSSGFGKSIAELLVTKNYTVLGSSRKGSNQNEELKYPMFKLDITDAESVNNCINEIISQYGRIDILINNAGFGISGSVEDTSMEEAKGQLETNFFGTIRMIKAALPIMRNQDKGLIINIGSIGGLIGLPYQAFYSASKFALEGLVEALRLELAGSKIQITNVCPGDFKTHFTASRIETKNANSKSSLHLNAYKRTLSIYEKDELSGSDPKELAELIEKLISRNGNLKVRYLVGQFLQKLGVTLKRFIGANLFELIMKDTYKIGKK